MRGWVESISQHCPHDQGLSESWLGRGYKFQLDPDYDAKLGKKPFTNPAEVRFGRTVRGIQTLGGVGALLMVSDIKQGFDTSTAHGVGRIADVGLSWGAFEAGLATVSVAGKRLGPHGRLFTGLGVGLVASYIADTIAGDEVENCARDAFHNALKMGR